MIKIKIFKFSKSGKKHPVAKQNGNGNVPADNHRHLPAKRLGADFRIEQFGSEEENSRMSSAR